MPANINMPSRLPAHSGFRKGLRLENTVLLLVAISVWPSHSGGFESIEHEMLGDTAFHIAIDIWLKDQLSDNAYDGTKFCESVSLHLPDLKPLARKCPVATTAGDDVRFSTYGDMNRLVDFVLYPSEILLSDSEVPRLPANSSESDLRCTIPERRLLRYPRSHAEMNPAFATSGTKKGGLGTRWARITSNNDTHFQGAAMRQFYDHHFSATSLAREGELFAAMVVNAVADHYLQDFFAPGHIVTPRENSHDAVALGMHDSANRVGESFLVVADRWPELSKIVIHIRERNSAKLGDAYRWIQVQDPAMSAELAIEHASERLLASTPQLDLHGDGLLSQYPDQQLLMLAVQARSILDVLDHFSLDDKGCLTYPSGGQQPINSFETFRWQSNSLSDESKRAFNPAAAIPYGQYELNRAPYDYVSSILMLGAGGETPLRDIGSSRLDIGVTVVPISLLAKSPWSTAKLLNRPDCRFWSLCNSAPAIGVHYLKDDEFDATGAEFRYIKVVPDTNLQLSGYIRTSRYSLARGSEWQESFGLRLDMGFSMFSLYVSLGKGFVAKGQDALEATTVVTFGAAGGISFESIRRFLTKNRYMPHE